MKTENKTSQYFGVCKVKNVSSRWAKKQYQAAITTPQTGRQAFKYFEEEKEAAKWIDLQLIKQGKEPVNILKRVTA